MEDKASMRRPHGTGTLYVQARANGREDWYGRCIWATGESTVAWDPSCAAAPERD